MSAISILIPAFNEAPVIQNTLRPLVGQGFEIIVIANGCDDNTAEVARQTAHEIIVLETPVGDKAKALNLGLMASYGRTVVMLDADTVTSPDAVRALAAVATKPDYDLAYGVIHFDLGRSSAAVRAFYKAWQQNSYFDRGKVGAFFALDRQALEAEGGFPHLTNDDEWVRRRFYRRSYQVTDARYSVQAPRTLSDLIAVRRRITRGNRQLIDRGYTPPRGTKSTKKDLLKRLVSRPGLWPGALVYALVTVLARASRTEARWDRDLSTRMQRG